MRSSAYEHIIPERLFSTEENPAEGVSTAKALSLAMAQGQKIYTLTTENKDQLSNITIDDNARSEISQALSIGLEVTVHERPITVNGWEGSGYSIIDTDYGVGAYKISGGASGGMLTLAAVALVSILGIVVTSTSLLVSLPIVVALALTAFFVSAAAAIVGPDYETYEVSIDIIGHIAQTMIFTSLLYAVGVLGAATLPFFIAWLAVLIIPIIFKYLILGDE